MINDADIRKGVLSELNISQFTQVEQDEILAKLKENITEKINISIFEMLTPADREVLPDLEKEDLSGEKVRKFLLEKIPNLPFLMEAIATSIVTDFKKMMQ